MSRGVAPGQIDNSLRFALVFTMLWSVLKRVANLILPEDYLCNEVDEQNWEKEEEEILNNINNFKNIKTEDLHLDGNEESLGSAEEENPNLESEKYLYKNGTITFLCSYYGLIDGKIYFDLDCVSSNLVVNKNDKVSFITSLSANNEAGKVLKICAISNESWDENGAQDTTPNCDSLNEFKAVRRVLVGKVSKVGERKFFVEPQGVWCNMDKLFLPFEPVPGDWINLEASVTVGDEMNDWVGRIVEVLSVKPTMTQNGPGRITFWVNGNNEGVINRTVFFNQSSCNDLYMPCLGDLVSYEAIESDQGKLKWRAIWVKPDKLKPRESSEKKLLKNKKGIEITQSESVLDLKINETKEVIVEVYNKGETSKILVQTRFFRVDKNIEGQLSVKSPKLLGKFTLKPSQRVQFILTCTGKVLGSTGELLEFHFEKFRIAKSFEINVLSENCVDELSSSETGRCVRDKKVKKITPPNEGNVVLCGSKPFANHRFFKPGTKENFDVPKTLWSIVLGPADIPKSTVDTISCLRKSLPYLSSGLSPETYVKRFHTLLHLEEIAIKLKFSTYDIPEGVFKKKEDFWFLEVSGLSEGRPSILQGDKVIVTRPWVSKTTHIGFVHKVTCNGIFVDFHAEFNVNYQGEKCDVKFVPNTGTIVKCHQAIGRAFDTMGRDWFFPSEVVEKSNVVCFDLIDDILKENGTKEKKEKREKKILVWARNYLNERQKLAVVNVLKGSARPLPYIIFGPPGTGKTTTIVETVYQVCTMIPYSKILICGPSNSSVDLVAERLIDSGLYKLGELIRLYAVSRVPLIPEKVQPYSESVAGRNDPGLVNEIGRKVRGAKIVLGTFSTVGNIQGVTPGEGPIFTHVFIDEAGQMMEPECLIPVCFLDKEKSQLILAGDPRQLGPVCTSTVAASFDLEKSFLERLISMYPYKPDRAAFPRTSGFDCRLATKLTFNYRSLPEIIHLPNQLFYDSDLIPLVSEKNSIEAKLLRHLDIKVPLRDNNPAIIFHGIVGKNLQDTNSPSWFNPQELCQLVVYLRKLYKAGLTADDVGIVTPYIKQVQKCRSVLESVNLAVPEIGTVNKFQGQEKHVIILSVVRSSHELLKKDMMFSLGFVASPRRLNVALTRARTLLIILGNPNLLRVDPYWEKVIDYCIRNKSYVGCNVKRVVKNDKTWKPYSNFQESI